MRHVTESIARELNRVETTDLKESEVWLLSSPLPFPLNWFAKHTWLVTVRPKEKINRWEVWKSRSRCKTSWGYLHKNLFPPGVGIVQTPWGIFGRFWPAKIEGKVTGKIAEEMISFIEKSTLNYPYRGLYLFWPGPNSNTYVRWIVKHFPHSGLKLPLRAWGKAFPCYSLAAN